MHNRISEVYQIPVNTAEGINTLRNWLQNHLDGSEVGGIANFYTSAPYGMSILPSGTPEEGKYVMTGWNYANHGLTISGYHDSIRWDYNNDGQYTNDLDINGDGEITPQDWEIGGFRFANTYSGGPSFGNNGFCYMTYKSCADPYGDGGIWNNAVHVLFAKENVDPLLTAKITLKHNVRNRIKVEMGVSTNQNTETPDYVMGLPIFNYQGGAKFMQGDTLEESKTIEFGVDLTPLLNIIGSGTPARYFLLVTEKDPEGWGTGDMVNYSLMDYTNGLQEIICNQSNVPLNNNSLSKFWVDHTVNYDGVSITTDTLPAATVYEPYSEQLEAGGGTTPYEWEFNMNFTESALSGDFPLVNSENITPGNTGSGYTSKPLDFNFPFYGNTFSEVRVHADGYITFEDLLSWPYQVYDFLNYTKNKYISPFQSDLHLFTSVGDGIWYEGDENSATFRWKASVEGAQNTSELNFAVQLFANGNIRVYYGTVNDYSNISWLSGVSAGNNKDYQFTDVSNDVSIPINHEINLEASHYPDGFSMTQSGELYGTATDNLDNFPVNVKLTDENNLTDKRIIYLSTDGSNYMVVDDFSVNAGGDDIIEYGETVLLSVTIKNLGEETISGNNMLIGCNSGLIGLIDSTELLGDFAPGEIKTFTDAFTFVADTLIPNEFSVDLPTQIADGSGSEWDSHIYLMAYAPELYAGSVIIDDGENGGLDPGETCDIIVNVYNGGGANAPDVSALLSTLDPYISINSNSSNIAQISAGGNGKFLFNVTASENTPIGYIAEFNIAMQANGGYSSSDQLYIVCGLLFESFETGNFEANPWEFSGNAEWLIDNSVVYDGNYSAKSGDVDDDENSGMQLELYVMNDGSISFYRKVSSEASYDFLRFYIDGIEMESWDGEQDWMEFSYPVSTGLHTFKWVYEKDYSVSNGDDCGWVDLITLPPYGDQSPQIAVLPEYLNITIQNIPIVPDTLWIQNNGLGPVFYTVEVADSLGNAVDWLSSEIETGGINPGYSDDVPVLIDATGLVNGFYQCQILITDHMGVEHPIPVFFTVDIVNTVNPSVEMISDIRCIPNPFNQQTTIQFTLKQEEKVSLSIFNNRGMRIRSIILPRELKAGTHRFLWDATNESGLRVNSGLYYYRLDAGEQVSTGKLMFMN